MTTTCASKVEDIEDLFSASSHGIDPSRGVKQFIYPNSKLKKRKISVSENNISDSVIPGTQSVYLKTWGCTHNNSDSEYMAGQLASYGYKIVDDKQEADLWVLNSCTVKNPAEDHFRNEIEAGRKSGKHIVVAGCVSQSSPSNPYLKGLSIIGVQQIDRVVEVVEETLKGNSVRFLGKKKSDGKKVGGASLQLPKIRKNELVEIIAISTGCLNQCTYCKTKHARGELGSYTPEEIVERTRQAINEGVCEIWLTSEDTGAYGRDINSSLPELLWKVLEVVPKDCMVRLGMTNPPYILDHLKEMGEILSHPRMYSFIHIPVQSGSDYVLADMKREYCRADFEQVVDYLKEKVPGISVATDVICGFPTETETDFEETLSLVKKYRFPSLFINQFFPRPGTPAAKMQRVPPQEVKKRTKQISELFDSYSPYEGRKGNRYSVLLTEISHDGKYFVGHNKYYEQILVPKENTSLKGIYEVEIVTTGKHFMIGRPISKKVSVVNTSSFILPQNKIINFLKVHSVMKIRTLENGSLKSHGCLLLVAVLLICWCFSKYLYFKM